MGPKECLPAGAGAGAPPLPGALLPLRGGAGAGAPPP